MTVEELIEALKEMPPTAVVEMDDDDLSLTPERIVYDRGVVTIEFRQEEDYRV